MNTEKEVWKTIEEYPSYQVSNLGRVKSKRGIRKPDKSGRYYRVNLSQDGVQQKQSIHRLVALTFIPNPNNYPIVNHLDGNKHNNRVDNLEWCTHKQNDEHAIRMGLKKGLTEEEKQEARELYKNGWTLKQLCDRYDVASSSIKFWLKDIHKYKYPTEQEKQEIKKLYDTGNYSMRKLGRMFDFNHTTVSRILKSRVA